MIDSKAMFIPAFISVERRVVVSRPISAVDLISNDDGSVKLGTLSQIRPGSTVEVCGEGFNDRTVKVHCHGKFYFVFLEDL